MKDSIEISPKYGVNPSVGLCFYCGEENGDVIMAGRIREKNDRGHAVFGSDVEAPRKAVCTMDPCAKCKDFMAQGIIFVSVKDADAGSKNPHRTGGWVVIKEEAIRRLGEEGGLKQELVEQLLERRFCFVPDTNWRELGLPELPVKENP